MTEENFSTRERVDALKTYGSPSDEVCYASRRLQKIGAVPFNGREDGLSKDVYSRAIKQAKENNEMVAVYLSSGEVQGLFLVTPGHTSPDLIDSDWHEFTKNADNNRWDKPIEEQKKEEPLDRFSVYEYGKKLYEKWEVFSKEEQYAAERLERMGVEPYVGKMNGNVSDIFWNAMKQAKAENNKVGVKLRSGVINGLFVVGPEPMADDKEYAALRFEQYVENQQKFRYDKPIAMQKAEEKQLNSLDTCRE
ncbi:MAG: hypothetical protein J6N49_06010 [Alphaproteobacteria bacterium]|nr:hypothetical protein [Alphaproteobacteria bacterium]